MKHTGRLLAVLAKGGEERCLIALLNTAQDVQVEVKIVFLLVENSRKLLRGAPGNILDRGIGYQVQVEFRAQLPLDSRDACDQGRISR